jgi:hypothetical protein
MNRQNARNSKVADEGASGVSGDGEVGARCQEAGCSVCDFLPFHCPICERCYCLQHRSRFVHRCIGTTSAANGDCSDNHARDAGGHQGKSAKEMFAAVEHRFDQDAYMNAAPNTQTHFPISSSQGPSTAPTSASAQNHIRKLDAITANAGKSEANRRIADKTKQMLFTRSATGDDNILPENRLYLRVKVVPVPNSWSVDRLAADVDDRTEALFVSRFRTLGEVLQTLATTHPRLFFASPSKPADAALVLYTEDSPDWRCWDRNSIISECLRDFETVYVSTASVNDVVEAQRQLPNKKPADSAEPVVSSVKETKRQLAKGEICLYTTSSGEQELVTVVSAHLDDFPNVYYTIRLHMQDNRERQTDSSRLQPVDSAAAAPSSSPVKGGCAPPPEPVAGGFKITVASGGETHSFPNLLPSTTVFQLKLMISAKLRVPASTQKLIFKGKVLGDKQTLGEAKITDNAKVLLMSATAGGSKQGKESGCMAV